MKTTDELQPPDVSTVILLGEAGSGKTQFFNQYLKGYFRCSYDATIGALYQTKRVNNEALEKSLNLRIYDTPGQERFRSTNIHHFLKDADTIIYFVDVTKSLEGNNIGEYQTLIKDHAPKNATVIVVMSKSDLEEKCFNEDELKSELERLKFTHNSIHTISAMTGENVKNLGDALVSCAVSQIEKERLVSSALDKIEKERKEEAKKSTPASQSSPKTTIATKKNTWQQIKKTIATRPYAVSILTGLALGAALSATGVFAPLGAGVLGIVGLSLIGGVAFGLATKVVKKYYQSKWEADLKKRHLGPTLEAVNQSMPALVGQGIESQKPFKSKQDSNAQYSSLFSPVSMSPQQIVFELQKLNPQELLSLHEFCTACSPSGSGKVIEKPACAKNFDIKSKKDKDYILEYIDATDTDDLKVKKDADVDDTGLTLK